MAEQAETRERLSWPGPLTVRTVTQARELVLAAFESCDSVEFELAPDADVDICALQFLHSARLEAKRTAKDFRLASPATGRLKQTLEVAGAIAPMSGADRAFWFEQGGE